MHWFTPTTHTFRSRLRSPAAVASKMYYPARPAPQDPPQPCRKQLGDRLNKSEYTRKPCPVQLLTKVGSGLLCDAEHSSVGINAASNQRQHTALGMAPNEVLVSEFFTTSCHEPNVENMFRMCAYLSANAAPKMTACPFTTLSTLDTVSQAADIETGNLTVCP